VTVDLGARSTTELVAALATDFDPRAALERIVAGARDG
jgi:hypothetical protein